MLARARPIHSLIFILQWKLRHRCRGLVFFHAKWRGRCSIRKGKAEPGAFAIGSVVVVVVMLVLVEVLVVVVMVMVLVMVFLVVVELVVAMVVVEMVVVVVMMVVEVLLVVVVTLGMLVLVEFQFPHCSEILPTSRPHHSLLRDI